MADESTTLDFEALREAAREAMKRAYAPYSSFPVGAAALVEDGRVVTGCNVEIYLRGSTMCAENTLVGQLAMTGGGRLLAFTCVDPAGDVLLPCGRCRQVLHEFGGDELLVETRSGIRPMSYLLPEAFAPDASPRLLSRPTGAVLAGHRD